MSLRWGVLLLSIVTVLPAARAQQPVCHTSEYIQIMDQQNPDYRSGMEAVQERVNQLLQNADQFRTGQDDVYTIPVVVHVVYNIPAENISDAQIFSQIETLNEDFRRMNADADEVPSAFEDVAADSYIEFVLASVDPDGNATNGITRNETPYMSWNLFAPSTADSFADKVKAEATGGADIWDRDCYLNIWVCDLGNSILGYASPPGTIASKDGVVVGYKWFGDGGSAIFPYNRGRTATHEIGHWLGLSHIWGDDGGSCSGSDGVADTPNQSEETYGCPSYPLTDACSPSVPGIMFMNYMDYTDDACMFMFTQGQANKMRGILEDERASIVECAPSVDVHLTDVTDQILLYPNPAFNNLFVDLPPTTEPGFQISVVDYTGRQVLQYQAVIDQMVIPVHTLPAGTYLIQFLHSGKQITKTFVVLP